VHASQAIRSPQGISVFGSALLRVAPDVVSLSFSATRLQKKPDAAFKEARAAAASIRTFLDSAGIKDVRASRISLSQHWTYANNTRRSDGYIASAAFSLLLDDLDRLEPVLSGVVAAGANNVDDVSFQSSELKQHRVRARRQAVAAAREKAAVYAVAASKGVGDVLHIEDVNPDQLRGGEGHVQNEVECDDDAPVGAFDPGSIAVGAAVLIVFGLTDENAG